MKNWKTTVIALAIAAAKVIENYQGAHTWQGYAQAIGIALFGVVCKDFNL